MSQKGFDFRNYLFSKLGQPRSLRRILMSVTGGLTLAILVFVELSVAYFTFRTERQAWRGRQSEAALNAAQAVGQFVHHAKDSLSLINVLDGQFLKANPQVMQDLFQQNPSLLEIVLLDASGNVWASAFQDRPVLANLFTIPQSKWYQEAIAGKEYFSGIQTSSQNEPYLILAMPAKGRGVIAARLSMNVLWNVVSDIRFGQAGRVYLVNQSGEVVAHTEHDTVLAHTNLKERSEYLGGVLSATNQWFGEYTNFEGIKVVGVTHQVPGTDWILFAELPRSEAYATTRSALIILGGGVLLFTIVARWLEAILFERQVFIPAEKLRYGVVQISQGNLNYRIGLKREDELGVVADAFDDMVVELSNRAQQVEQEMAERKQAEETLKINESRYRAIVEDQTELICRWKPDGTLTFVNEAYCRYFGKPREELVGNSFRPLIPEEDHKIIDEQLKLLGTENPVVTYEHRVVLPDSVVRWQNWTDRAIFDESGDIIELTSVGRDVTERQINKLDLQKKTLQQEKLIEIAHKITTSLDLDAVLMQIAIGAQEILDGFGCALYLLEPDGKTLIPVVAIDEYYQQELSTTSLDIDCSFSGQAVKARRGLIFNDAADDCSGFQIPGTPANEEEFIITVPLIVDEAVLGVMCLNRYDKRFDEGDLTTAEVFATYAATALLNSRSHNRLKIEVDERKKAEEALRRSEELYRLITENITDIVWVRDMNLRTTFISPSVSRLRGFSVEEAMAQTVEQICTPESAETARRFFTQILIEAYSLPPDQLVNESRSLELELVCKNGSTMWTESSMRFLFDQDNKPLEILGATRDISERKRAEEALRKLNDELEERVRQRTVELSQLNLDLTNEVAERTRAEEIIRASLQEKEILLKEIHHRVKNNLQVISSLLSLQARKVQDPASLEQLRESQNRVRSMALIHEKLYQSKDLSKVDFSEYVQSLTAHLMRTYNNFAHDVQLNVQVEGVYLPIDRAVPCGLLLNELISNSLKYAFPNGKNGEITIQLKPAQDSRISLIVSDNGIGIPAEVDFHNTSSLGLQLVNTLVNQIEGTIELDRSQGTCYYIEFAN